jgi:isopentenyldiphosphate isomerase
VDGATVKRLAEAVRAGDMAQVRAILKARPELVHMDMADNNEHRALHCAVLDRAPEMVRLSQRRAKAKRIFQSLGTSLCIGYV